MKAKKISGSEHNWDVKSICINMFRVTLQDLAVQQHTRNFFKATILFRFKYIREKGLLSSTLKTTGKERKDRPDASYSMPATDD